MFFDDNPEIMDKLIDNMYIGTRTASDHRTDEHFELWKDKKLPPSYKSTPYEGKPDLT